MHFSRQLCQDIKRLAIDDVADRGRTEELSAVAMFDENRHQISPGGTRELVDLQAFVNHGAINTAEHGRNLLTQWTTSQKRAAMNQLPPLALPEQLQVATNMVSENCKKNDEFRHRLQHIQVMREARNTTP